MSGELSDAHLVGLHAASVTGLPHQCAASPRVKVKRRRRDMRFGPPRSVQADGQRYDFVSADNDQRVIRYEAVDGSFTADIRVDRDGIVIDYPGIAHRL